MSSRKRKLLCTINEPSKAPIQAVTDNSIECVEAEQTCEVYSKASHMIDEQEQCKFAANATARQATEAIKFDELNSEQSAYLSQYEDEQERCELDAETAVRENMEVTDGGRTSEEHSMVTHQTPDEKERCEPSANAAAELSQHVDEQERCELDAETAVRENMEVTDGGRTSEEYSVVTHQTPDEKERCEPSANAAAELSQHVDEEQQRDFAAEAVPRENMEVVGEERIIGEFGRSSHQTTDEQVQRELVAKAAAPQAMKAAKVALGVNRLFTCSEILLDVIGRLPPTPTSLGLAAVSKLFAMLILNRIRCQKILKEGMRLDTNDQLRFWRMYINMRGYEARLHRKKEEITSDTTEDGIRTAFMEAHTCEKLPNWLLRLPLELFCCLWPKEKLVPESIETAYCSASQPNPVTKATGSNFERILNVLKQLTEDSSPIYHATPLKVLVCRGTCRWEDTELALDASWAWCKGTLHTAMHILKAYDVDPETHFWAVVATMLLISHTAEEMVPILNWGDRNAGRYRQVWLGARHELPCLLHLLLWQVEGKHAEVTNGVCIELMRTIDCLALYDPRKALDPSVAESKYPSQRLPHEAMEASEAAPDDFPHRSHETKKASVAESKDPSQSFSHEAMETSEFCPQNALETPEQRAVIDLDLSMRPVVNAIAYTATGKTHTALEQKKMSMRPVVNVKAYAGTGKTHTALEQQKKICGNSMMLFYNKSAQQDATVRLQADDQSHVSCYTLDGLITTHTDLATRRRACNVNAELIKKVIPRQLPKFGKRNSIIPFAAIGVSRLLKKFLFSDKNFLHDSIFIREASMLDRDWAAMMTPRKGKRTKYAIQPPPLWIDLAEACLTAFTSDEFMRMNLCFEALTKLVQLKTRVREEERKGRNLAEIFDPFTMNLLERTKIKPLMLKNLPIKPVQVVIDEAQDLSPAQYDLFVRMQKESVSIILLGDPYQSINGFRGAGNSVFTGENNVSDSTLPLTISHRFGASIAEKVTESLRTIYRGLGSIDPLIGVNENSGLVLCSRTRDELIGASYKGNTVIITCSNIGMIREALNVCTQLQSMGITKTIALVKGPKLDVIFERIRHLVQLSASLSYPFVFSGNSFNDLDEVLEWAEEHENTELMSACAFANELKSCLGREFASSEAACEALDLRLEAAKNSCIQVDSATNISDKCDLVISNTHQQKGNEFPVVIMSNDFASLQGERGFVSPRTLQDRFNLIYVAMTRACDVLVLNRDLDFLMYHHLRPPVAVLRLPCTITAECSICGGVVEGSVDDFAEVDGESGASQGSWASSTRRWGLCMSIDRHARGYVPAPSQVVDPGPPSGCCSTCLSETLQLPIRQPSWALPAISPEGLTEFWGPQVLPPPPEMTME